MHCCNVGLNVKSGHVFLVNSSKLGKVVPCFIAWFLIYFSCQIIVVPSFENERSGECTCVWAKTSVDTTISTVQIISLIYIGHHATLQIKKKLGSLGLDLGLFADQFFKRIL